MNTIQIQTILSNEKYSKDSFIGVYPSDKLNFKINRLPTSLVVNTDPSWKSGEHWVCFYINEDEKIEYFDSYGLPPLNQDILNFFKENGKNHTYSKTQLQGWTSRACGHYCILYLISKSRLKTTNEIISCIKGTYPGENDRNVIYFVNNVYNVKTIVPQIGKGSSICQCCKSLYVCCKHKIY